MSECASIASKSIAFDLQFIFHRETHDSSLDRAKMGVVFRKVSVVAQLDIRPTQPSTSSYAYGNG